MVSGTSHDGVDVAVVEFTETPGEDGDVVRARLGEHRSVPYSPALRADLVAALPPGRPGFAQVCALDVRIGQEFAAAAAAVGERFDLVCSHGQTVFHRVDDGAVRGTLQLGQPAWTAEATGVPVVSDLRTADVVAGGQGAPLVPLLDRLLLAPFLARGLTSAALNLGGIDRDGRLAAAGAVEGGLLTALLAEEFSSRSPPETTGEELFHPGYVTPFPRGRTVPRPDLLATLTELTVRTVADALTGVDVVVASGGGVRNPVLLAGLRREPGQVLLADDLGCPAGERPELHGGPRGACAGPADPGTRGCSHRPGAEFAALGDAAGDQPSGTTPVATTRLSGTSPRSAGRVGSRCGCAPSSGARR